MTNYYFVASYLPEIKIGQPLDITWEEFNHLINDNLKPKDLAKTKIIKSYFDLENIRAALMGEPFEPFGNYNEVELKEVQVSGMGLPNYLYQFLEKYRDKVSLLKKFPELISLYFREENESKNGFLFEDLKEHASFFSEWLQIESDLRLIVAAYRSKKLKRDLKDELQFADPQSDLVVQLLATKDAKTFEPPYEYADLKPIFEKYDQDPLGLYQALLEWRFQKIEDLLGVDIMSENRIFGYMIQLILALKWHNLNEEKGKATLNQIVALT